MNTVQTAQVLYYVIIIIILIALIIFFISLYIPYSPEDENENSITNDDKRSEDSQAYADTPGVRREFKLQRTADYEDTASFQLVEPQEEVEDDVITYKKYLTIYQTPGFVRQFTSALKESFESKLVQYKFMLSKVNIDYNRAKAKVKNPFELNDRVTQLNKQKVELESVVKILETRLNTLSPSTTAKNLCEAITNTKHGLASLIGRVDVKDQLALQLYSFAYNPRAFYKNHQNIVIYGSSGIGKTKLASVISYVYAISGIQARRKFRNITKKELTNAYVDQAPHMTAEILNESLEGVCFIDEAYQLGPDPKQIGHPGHGPDAIAEMVNFLDKNRGLLIVIAAGYEKEMESRFMNSNEGMPRRFPTIIRLKNYDASELTDILIDFLYQDAPNMSISESEANYIYTLIHFIYSQNSKIFDKQAGDMENLARSISAVAYGCTKLRWETNNHAGNSRLLLNGFNQFLTSKDVKFNLKQSVANVNTSNRPMGTKVVHERATETDTFRHGESHSILQPHKFSSNRSPISQQ